MPCFVTSKSGICIEAMVIVNLDLCVWIRKSKDVNFLVIVRLHETIFQTSKLTANAEIHLFKAGVEPKWEDPECANGGKWTWVVTANRKEALDKGWLETLMALIGEQFDEADEICGVVASVRPQSKQDKLSLWTRTKSNEAVLV